MNSMSIAVKLEWYEYMIGAFVGIMRHLESRRAGFKNHINGKALLHDIDGALAEIAAAKAMNIYCGCTINTFKTKPDIGHNVDVRLCRYSNGHLEMKSDDIDDRWYVLVRGIAPEYEVVGRMLGRDGKQECWFAPKLTGGGMRHFLVPEEELIPINDLCVGLPVERLL